MINKVIFIAIFLLAAFFRLSGNNWDQGYHLHPDERFLTMVTTALKWPQNISSYLDTSTSTMNPHNMGYGFYVYGTFPVFFTKWVAGFFNWDNYADVTLIGRFLSGLVDLGTLTLIYLIASQLVQLDKLGTLKKKKSYFPAISAFLYAGTVLSIQLSHYYTVDTYVTFFLTLAFFIGCQLFTAKAQFKHLIFSTALGISLGLAVASKISAILFLPIIIFVFFYKSVHYSFQYAKSISKFLFNFLYVFLIFAILFLISAYLTIRLAQPYLFAGNALFSITLNPKVLANWKELQALGNPGAAFPPAVQWTHTKPYIYPLKHNFFYGLGIPLGTIIFLGITFLVFRSINDIRRKKIKVFTQLLNTKHFILLLCLLWIIILFTYQGKQYSMNLRYFHPIYPFLSLLAGYGISLLLEKYFKSKILTVSLIGGSLLLLYPVAFISIYNRPVSRVAASSWIYDHIAPGATLLGEHWDDFIPLGMEGKSVFQYKPIELPVYGMDTKEKWNLMIANLAIGDYIILSSNRAFGSISSAPDRFPIMQKYYQSLFDGSLGFAKVAEFTSRPLLPIPGIHICITPPFIRYGIVARKSQECQEEGISYVDDYADESFTVYDHPKVIIFKKVKQVDYGKLLHVPK